MANRVNAVLQAYNRGRISKLSLARTDIDRVRLSAEIQTNWMPRVLGSMMLRPGFGYIGATNANNATTFIPFIFARDDMAKIELTDSTMRVWVDDAPLTRVSVSSALTNGTFDTTITGWTDISDTAATASWATGGYLSLKGTHYSAARVYQQVSVSGADTGQRHAVRLTLSRGYTTLRIGSSLGAMDYFSGDDLRPGVYSIPFTPTGSFYVQLSARTEYASLVDSISIESAGIMTIPTPWSATDIRDDTGYTTLRWDQSADVIFVAADGQKQKRIERWVNPDGWAVVDYTADDGPFRNENTDTTRINPTGLTGDVSLQADRAEFTSGNVGGLYRITSLGQTVTGTFTGGDQWSNSIRVSGVGASRYFDVAAVAGSTISTVRVQRSLGEEGAWTNVTSLAFTSSSSQANFSDGLDNQIAFYRIGAGSTDYTSGTASGLLSYDGGGLSGIARIMSFQGSTLVSATVLRAFGSTSPSELWAEGEWSSRRGFPSCVVLHDGRLCWAGKSKQWLSVSDGYESFDSTTEGDSGPVNRSIGSGPVDVIEWLISSARLLMGGQSREMQVKTSSLDEPITPTNWSLKDISTQGSAKVQAVKIDKRALFVQGGGTRVMDISPSDQTLDYETTDRTVLVPDIGEPNVIRMFVQRQPDTRLHCIRSDGTVALLVSDPAENVTCWIDIETDGDIEDAVVLPGDVEDQVYYVVKRTSNGSTVRYLEKWALESECIGDTLNKQADSFLVYQGSPTSTLTAAHLAGSTSLVIWADGISLNSSTGGIKTFSASTDGAIAVTDTSGNALSVSNAVYGLAYGAQFKSSKLAYGARAGTALTQNQKVNAVGLILANTHNKGLMYGPSTSSLRSLPDTIHGRTVSSTEIHAALDNESINFTGNVETDPRFFLVANAPRPATVLAAVLTIETDEKV